MKLKVLIGSGDKIMLFTSPFLVAGLILNLIYPAAFSVGGPSFVLSLISIIVLIPGATIWGWSVVLILLMVPQNKLITVGPYSLLKHPLYTGVALLVIPWAGFLLNSWLGVVIGLVLYTGSRIYSVEEEKMLLKMYGSGWNEYCRKIIIPWL